MENIKELLKTKQAEREALMKDVSDFEALLTEYFGDHIKYTEGTLSWTAGQDGPNAVVVSFGHMSLNAKTGWVSKCLLRIDGRFNEVEPANADRLNLDGSYKMNDIDRRYILDNAEEIFKAFKTQALVEFQQDATVRAKFEIFKKSLKVGKTS